MPRCPSLKGKNGIGGPTVRLSLGRGAGRRAEHGHRTHRNTSPPFLQLGKCRPRAPGGPRGRSARCGNGLFAQCVRLRSEINRAPGRSIEDSGSQRSFLGLAYIGRLDRQSILMKSTAHVRAFNKPQVNPCTKNWYTDLPAMIMLGQKPIKRYIHYFNARA